MPPDLLTIADAPDWLLETIRGSGPAGVFYHRRLLELWEKAYGWQGVMLCEDATAIIGFRKSTPLGNMYYSLPYGWYGGFVGDRAGCSAAKSAFDWLASQGFIQENIVQLGDDIDAEYPSRYRWRDLSTHILQLDESLQYSTNTVRNLKKARESDLTSGTLAPDLRESFTRLLRGHIERSKEKRILSEQFYLELFSLGLQSDSGVEVNGAFLEKELVACHIYFRTESDLFYFDGFCNQTGLETCANFLLFDSVIRVSREREALRFNLGATPEGDQGLQRFKAGWGAESMKYREYYRRSPVKRAIDWTRGK